MNRPWKIWLWFALCAAVMLGVMGWVSRMAMRLDRSQAEARAQAELEEKVRLALWRMDSMLSPLIAQESARPYFSYSAFHPAERAYGKMYNALAPSEVLVPSPLLTQVSSNILLHFQFDPEGRLTSPQVPSGNQRDLAEAQFTTHERVELAAERLREFQRIMAQEISTDFEHIQQVQRSSSAPPLRNRDILMAAAPPPGASDTHLANVAPVIHLPLQERLKKAAGPELKSQQGARSAEELQARAQSVQQAFDLNVKNVAATLAAQDGVHVSEGIFKPVWFDNALVLVRRVSLQEEHYVQGCWLDWRGIRQWLLSSVHDLLPGGILEPIQSNGDDQQSRMLAALPVRLIPGTLASAVAPVVSPIRFALVLAWGCILLAGLAVALLLHGTLTLSERRAAFVSAVTHELRTPLTTFKMYSEILADDMVPEESRRREYLSTLCAEANRLNHLVENVLAYARLEHGSARSRVERLTLRELISRVKPRLAQRALQAGMVLQEDADRAALESQVQVDVAAVDQVLFNLVDNACKYGRAGAGEGIIHLEATANNGGFAIVRVRDEGRGIAGDVAKRLFRPFSKPASEAANTAPGVGLGLALCRRLVRSLGGDLRLDTSLPKGACFELILPRHNGRT